MRASEFLSSDPRMVEECKKLLDEATRLVGSTEPPMSGVDRNRRLKVLMGGEMIVPILASLCAEYGVTELGRHSTDDMLAMLEHARRMRELSHFASNFHKLTVDSNLRAQSGYWKIATAMYTTLLRLANDEPNLKMALAPVVAFFAKGPRAKT